MRSREAPVPATAHPAEDVSKQGNAKVRILSTEEEMKKESKFFYGWIVVIGCMLITTTMVPLIMSQSNKYLIYVTEDLGMSRSAFTLANTILQGLGIFLSPIISKNLATGNMKKIHAISIVGFAACYAAYSFATSPIHLYITAVFVGIFYLNATIIPVSMMITNWFNKKRGLAMSLAMAGIGIGGTIYSPLITYLLENFGWRNTYRIVALIVVVVALPTVLFLLKRSPEEMGLQPLGADEVTGAQAEVKENAVRLTVSESKFRLFFILVLIGTFANGIINAGALGQFPPAIQELHGPAIQATIISLYSFIGIGGKLLLGWLNDKLGVVISTTLGCISFGLSFVFMLMATDNVTMLYFMAAAFGFGNAIGTVTPPLVTAEIFGKKKYGEAYGIINSFMQVGLSLGSLVVAGIYDMNGSYTMAWVLLLVFSGVTLVGWIGSIFLAKKYKEA